MGPVIIYIHVCCISVVSTGLLSKDGACHYVCTCMSYIAGFLLVSCVRMERSLVSSMDRVRLEAQGRAMAN